MQTIFNEVSLSIVLVVLIGLFFDPFMLWMPDSMVFVLIGFALVAFAGFVGLVWSEKALDERDELHRMIAGRIGYLLGSGVLLFGIVWQSVFSHPDPWLVGGLIAMVLGKLLGLYYSRHNN